MFLDACFRLRLMGAGIILTALCLSPERDAWAEEALVAVAANFEEPAGKLVTEFEAESGHKIKLVTGSTGKLYAQIINGAPFHAFLAADEARPRRLVEEGRGVAGSRFTYALGRLVLWSTDDRLKNKDGEAVLREGAFRRLAMANPDLAPYGAAGREVLGVLHLDIVLRDKIVLGENVGQAFAMVSSGNAELGFVALPQVISPRNRRAGSRWEVPSRLYAPIRQDAVLLLHGADNGAAKAFLDYLKSDAARDLIRQAGYEVA